jgi:hypothetical protein
MRFTPLTALLCALALLAAGCASSPHPAAPYAKAAVEVAGADDLEIALALRNVFIRNGYTARGGSGREYKFDRIGGTGDQLIYGSFLAGGDVTYRVTINIIGLDGRRYVIAASPQIVRSAGDVSMEETSRTSRGRKDVQKLLEQVKADLEGVSAPK